MTLLRRRTALAALGGALAAPAPAQTGAFPDRPVRLIVPLAPGGPTDAHGRVLAEIAGRILGQPVVVENRPGASATLGAQMLATDTRADGHLVGLLPVTVFRLPAMQRRPAFDPLRDFTYIIHLTGYTYYVAVRADGPWRDWAAFLAHSKANPGKVSYGTPGAGTSLHIGMETIAARQGVKFTHVPFKGNAETNAAVLGGHTSVAADSSGWKPLVQAGQLRLLAVWTADRLKDFPDVPTLRDLGMPYVFDSPFGIAGPKGMDLKIVAKIHDAFKKAIDDPAVQATLTKYDMVVNYKNSADYAKAITENIEAERQVIERLGLAKTGG